MSKNTVPTFPEMKLPAGEGRPHDIYCFFLAGEISESINLGLGAGGGGGGGGLGCFLSLPKISLAA